MNNETAEKPLEPALSSRAHDGQINHSTLARCTRGAQLVEYLMLVGAVALVCIVSVTLFGNMILQKSIEQTGGVQDIKDKNR